MPKGYIQSVDGTPIEIVDKKARDDIAELQTDSVSTKESFTELSEEQSRLSESFVELEKNVSNLETSKMDKSSTYDRETIDIKLKDAEKVKTVNGVQPNANGDVLLTDATLPAEALDVEARNSIAELDSRLSESIDRIENVLGEQFGADSFIWNIGKTISSSGVYQNAAATAVTDLFEVAALSLIINISDKIGMNNKETVFHVNQYEDGMWQSRTIVDNGGGIVLDKETNGVRLTFGYTGKDGNTETQEDVNDRFRILIIKGFATKEEVNNVINIVSNAVNTNYKNYKFIADGTDYDNITECGDYLCSTMAHAKTMINCPVEVSHKLIVMETTSHTKVYQMIFANNSDSSIWYRNGVESWQKISNAKEYQSLLDSIGNININIADIENDIESLKNSSGGGNSGSNTYEEEETFKANNYTWTIGKTISATGAVTSANATAITEIFSIKKNTTIYNISDRLGMNNKETIFHVNQYVGGVWRSRTILENGGRIKLNDETDGVRLTFGYAGSAGNNETQEDVNEHFAVKMVTVVVVPSGSDTGSAVTYNYDTTVNVGENLYTSASYSGANWTYSNGTFTHASGSDAPLVLPVTFENGKRYLITYDFDQSSADKLFCTIGNGAKVDIYYAPCVGLTATGDNVYFYPVSSWTGTISNINVFEIVEDGTQKTFVVKNVQSPMSMGKNIGGFWNVILGDDSTMAEAENVSRSIAIGRKAMAKYVDGDRNIAIGSFAGSAIVSGTENLAIGIDCAYLGTGTNQENNIAIGDGALCHLGNGNKNNTAVGRGAIHMLEETNGSGNTALGKDSDYYGGNNNTAIGHQAGYSFGHKGGTSEAGNVAVGYKAGTNYTTISKSCVAIGDQAKNNDPSATDSNPKTIINAVSVGAKSNAYHNNSVAIGANAITSAENEIQLGDNSKSYSMKVGNRVINFNSDGTVTWAFI